MSKPTVLLATLVALLWEAKQSKRLKLYPLRYEKIISNAIEPKPVSFWALFEMKAEQLAGSYHFKAERGSGE